MLKKLKALEVSLRGNNRDVKRCFVLCAIAKLARKKGRYHEARGYVLAALDLSIRCRSIYLSTMSTNELDKINECSALNLGVTNEIRSCF